MALGDTFSLVHRTSIPNGPVATLLTFLLPAGDIDGIKIDLEGANASSNVIFGFAIDGVAQYTNELTVTSGTNEVTTTGLNATVTNDQWGTISVESPFTSGALSGVTAIGVHVIFETQTVNLTGNQTVAGVKTFSSSPVVPTPSGSTDAANKAYVDTAVAAGVNGLTWKQSVRVATTANGTLSSAFANGQTVDGVTLSTGDRILIKNQSSGAENGIYTVNASGAPTRATDADTGAEMLQATVSVQEGTTNADTTWVCTTNATITLGSTALTFTQLSGAGIPDGDKGDVTVSSSGTVWTVDNDAITYAKIQNVSATDRILGRDTAGAGDIEELTVSGGLEFTGTGIQRSALTGDVTATAGSSSTTIANDAVTYAKMQNVSAASKLLGRGDSGSGDVQEITLGTGLSMSGTTLNSSGGTVGSGTFNIDDGTAAAAGTFVFDDGTAA